MGGREGERGGVGEGSKGEGEKSKRERERNIAIPHSYPSR